MTNLPPPSGSSNVPARVDIATGEVLPAFDFDAYTRELVAPAALKRQQQLAAAYDQLCASLLGPNDIQEERGRKFKKKSAWRKLARHFGISTQVLAVQRDVQERPHARSVFVAWVTVRAVAPWGQASEAIGACGTDEATGRRTITIADAIATAETRATNRAISNLIAMGEETAEERVPSRGPDGLPDAIPFGQQRGRKLVHCSETYLVRIREWCVDKDDFPDVVEAIDLELERRRAAAEDAPPPANAERTTSADELPVGDDGLPF